MTHALMRVETWKMTTMPRLQRRRSQVCVCVSMCRVGQNHIYIYIRCIYGVFGRKITKCTVMYGVYTQFWPSLSMCVGVGGMCVHQYVLMFINSQDTEIKK